MLDSFRESAEALPRSCSDRISRVDETYFHGSWMARISVVDLFLKPTRLRIRSNSLEQSLTPSHTTLTFDSARSLSKPAFTSDVARK